MKVIVNPWVKEFVEKSPQYQRNSACGWLIGLSSSNDQIIILSAIAASRYVDTDYSYRLPDPQELEELMQIIPAELKIIGMYHFKPGAQLKIISKAGIPEKFYAQYRDKIICITNTETTKIYQVNGTEYKEMEVYYHELPENLMKSLVILVNITLATKINLKLSFLPQILKDIIESLESTLLSSKVSLCKSSILTELSRPSKPFLTKDSMQALLKPNTVLKDDLSLISLFQSHFSSITSRETFLSLDIPINLISDEEDLTKQIEDKFVKYLGGYAKFTVPCVILLNLQHPQSPEEIFSILLSQLKTEIEYVIPRSMIKYSYNRQGLLILPPESHLMQYKDLLLNFKAHLKKVEIIKQQFELELVENLLHLSYFSQNTLPDINQSFFTEDDKLVRYRQRFSALAKLGDKSLGIGLLQGLGYIYKERGQIDSIKEVQRLVSSL